ncbi:MAG TPA: hypothetical protein VF469_10750, partial [Kofleriaceae bacterium]
PAGPAGPARAVLRGGRGRAATLGAVAAAALSSCSGPSRPQIAIGPLPPRDTHAVLAGALCADNQCTCRGDGPGDGGVGVPEATEATNARKRYEFRMTSAYDLWVTINRTTVLYKSPERAEACFYVDLPSGDQQVELRAENPDGVSAGLQIHELGTRTKSWYDTFAWSCGVPGVCSFEDLEAQRAQLAGGKHNLFDRCGTTKVKGITWDHGRAPDQLHPSQLVLRLTLDIYRLAATKRHGDATCGQGRRGSDVPAPGPNEAP